MNGFADAVLGFEGAVFDGELCAGAVDLHFWEADDGHAFFAEEAVQRNIELIGIPEEIGRGEVIELAEGDKDLADFSLGVLAFQPTASMLAAHDFKSCAAGVGDVLLDFGQSIDELLPHCFQPLGTGDFPGTIPCEQSVRGYQRRARHDGVVLCICAVFSNPDFVKYSIGVVSNDGLPSCLIIMADVSS